MIAVKAKRDRQRVKLTVKSGNAPELSDKTICPLCRGKLKIKFISHKIDRDYDEVWITLVLQSLPAAVCENCTAPFVLDELLSQLDPYVEKVFEAVLNERNLVEVSLDETLLELAS